jgi:YD repeat-containing protein
MKRILFSVAVVASLSSCNKDALVDPAPPQTASSAQARSASSQADDLPTLTTPHRLIKHDGRTLEYDDKGRLAKVSEGTSLVTTYSYQPDQWVVKTTRNAVLVSNTTFLLNPYGRCVKIKSSRLLGFNVLNGKQVPYYSANQTFNVIVDEVGRLVKLDTYSDTMERYEFSYDAAGNLSQIRQYDPTSKVIRKITYAYDKPYAGQPQLDMHPLNPEINDLGIEPYLTIFGTFRKHLIRSCKIENVGGSTQQEYYKYKLADDGYVTSMEVYNGVTNAYIRTIPFEFKTILPILKPNF